MNDFANAGKGRRRESLPSRHNMLKQIERGMEQISVWYRRQFRAGEETSATSQEISAQSEGLKNLVGRFNGRVGEHNKRNPVRNYNLHIIYYSRTRHSGR